MLQARSPLKAASPLAFEVAHFVRAGSPIHSLPVAHATGIGYVGRPGLNRATSKPASSDQTEKQPHFPVISQGIELKRPLNISNPIIGVWQP